MHIVRFFLGTGPRILATLTVLTVLFGLCFPDILGDAANRLVLALMPIVKDVLALVIMIGAIVFVVRNGLRRRKPKKKGK